MKTTLAAGLALTALAAPALAQADLFETTNITFDELAPAPGSFAVAGRAQTITLEGVTFSGGVLLGTEYYGVANSNATQPNLYGVSSIMGTHSRTMTIDIESGANAVSGTLYNGLNRRILYSFQALDGAGNVVAEELQTVYSILSGGHHTFSLDLEGFSNAITRVEITPLEDERFNYTIDDINVTRSTVPAPGAAAGLGFAGLLAARRRR